MTERITAKAFAPSVERNSPEIFCLTLKVLTALSDALLSGGIFQSYKNGVTIQSLKVANDVK
jgi:hypothetical protein